MGSLEEIIKLQWLNREALLQLDGVSAPNQALLEEIVMFLGSVVINPRIAVDLVDTWLMLVSKVVVLFSNDELEMTYSVIGPAVKIGHTLMEVAKLMPAFEQKVVAAMAGTIEQKECSEARGFLTAPFRLAKREVEFFERFKSLHHFNTPKFHVIIRRALLMTDLQFQWKSNVARALNQDYFDGKIGDAAFDVIFVRWVYDGMFGTRIVSPVVVDGVNDDQLVDLVYGRKLEGLTLDDTQIEIAFAALVSDALSPGSISLNGTLEISSLAVMLNAHWGPRLLKEKLDDRIKMHTSLALYVIDKCLYVEAQEKLAAMDDLNACFDILLRLNIDAVPCEERKSVCAFWVNRVKALLCSLEHADFDTKFVADVMRLGWCAVGIYVATGIETVLYDILDDSKVEEYQLPSCFPLDGRQSWRLNSYEEDGVSEFWMAYKPFECPTTVHLIARSLLFGAMAFGVADCVGVKAANPDYIADLKSECDVPDMSLSEVTKFCALRYIAEGVIGKKELPRLLESTRRKRKTSPREMKLMPLALFVYAKFEPVRYHDAYDSSLLFLILLNRGIIAQTYHFKEPTSNAWIMAGFTRDLTFDLSCLHKKIDVVMHTMRYFSTDVDFLVMDSRKNVPSASIALLSHPECGPFLSDKFVHHQLLRVFLRPEKTKEWVDLDFEVTPAVCAQFLWEFKLGTDSAFNEVLLVALYRHLCFLSFEIWGEEKYANAFLGKKRNESVVLDTKESFFLNDLTKMVCIQTMLVTVVEHCKTLGIMESLDRNMLMDISNHCNAPQKLRELIGEIDENRLLFWTVMGVFLDSDRSGALDWNTPLASSAFGPIVSLGNTEIISAILASRKTGHFDTDLVEELCYFATKPLAEEVAKCMVDQPIEFVIDMLWKFMTGPTPWISVCIMSSLSLTTGLSVRILNAAPPEIAFVDPVPVELIGLCHELLFGLPRGLRNGKRASELPSHMTMEWESQIAAVETPVGDTATDSDEQPVNLWADDLDKVFEQLPCEKASADGSKRIGYVCNDCGRDKHLCLACASRCHRGHDVSYDRLLSFTCACAELGSCGDKFEVDPARLTAVFVALARIENADVGVVKPFAVAHLRSEDICKMSFAATETAVRSRVCFSEHGNCVIARRRMLNHERYGRASEMGSPPLFMNVTTAVNNFIFVAEVGVIRGFDTDFNVVSHIDIERPPMILKAQAIGSDILLAVASPGDVRVFKITDDVIITSMSRQSVEFDSNTAPLSLEWIADNHLAVLLRRDLLIFNISVSDLAPELVESFCSTESAMTSVIYVPRDLRLFAVIAFEKGRMGIEPLLERGQHDMRIRNFAKWDTTYVSVYISCCLENDLMFMCAPGILMHVYRLSTIFDKNVVTLARCEFRKNDTGPVFVGHYPGRPSVMLFTVPGSNVLCSLDVTRESVKCAWAFPKSMNEKTPRNEWTVYGHFTSRGKLYLIDREGIVRVAELHDVEEKEPDVIFDEYNVHPAFWKLADRADRNTTEITGTDTSQNYNTLYTDSVAYFNVGVFPRVMRFHVKDPSECIVGVSLAFARRGASSLPPYVKLNGRKHKMTEGKNHMFALMPHEVKIGQGLELEFAEPNRPQNYEMQSAAVFTMPFAKVAPFVRSQASRSLGSMDWMQGHSITDFSDDCLTATTAHSILLKRVVTSIFISDTHAPFEDSLIRRLVRVMYTSPESTVFARAVLVRIIDAQPDITRSLLADELKSLITDGLIADSFWASVWHDVSLMDIDTRSDLTNILWSRPSDTSNVDMLICAFSS